MKDIIGSRWDLEDEKFLSQIKVEKWISRRRMGNSLLSSRNARDSRFAYDKK